MFSHVKDNKSRYLPVYTRNLQWLLTVIMSDIASQYVL